MRSRKIVILSVLTGLALLAGCSPKDLRSLEGKLFFKVHELYPQMAEGVEPALVLSMETEKVYPCCNYIIEFFRFRMGSLLRLDIRGVQEPFICLTAMGPAVAGDILDLAEGDYSIEFKNGPARSVFGLEVRGDSLTIVGAGGAVGGFAVPKIQLFWRYPRNSFAVLCGTTDNTVWIYEDFLARLRDAVDLQEHEFPTYGEIGYPRAPQGSRVNHPARYFLYGEDTDFAAAGEVLRSYVRDVIGQTPGVSIWLLNWKNECFRSWQMAGTPD